MSLEAIFFMSQSIAAVIVSVTLIVFVFYFVRFMREIGLISKKVLEAAEGSVEAVEEASQYIEKVGKSAVNYFVVKLIKSVKGKK